MQCLNLPPFAYKVQYFKTGYKIFDVIRKKYVQLTAEEWVRQHFLHYLITFLGYPCTLMKLEQTVPHRHFRHRPDVVIYNRKIKPLMLVECKAPYIPISKEVWGQLVRYNVHFSAQLLAITNGIEHRCWQLDYEKGHHTQLPRIPCFHMLS
mmetsp:Transcript_6001/g.13329  ORF Transcript_6001/g.13329 Transcript_6001/m.13329 type:complete len:151 (-) Transcript_6001:1685-2137(-)